MAKSVVTAFLSALMLGLCAVRAQAQMIDGAHMATPVPDYAQSLIYGQTFSKSYRDRVSGKRGVAAQRKTAHGSVPPSYPRDDFRVSFAPEVSSAVRHDYIAAIARSTNPRVASELDNFYARNPVRSQFEIAIRPYGLRSDDLADIAAAHLVVMWMTANDAALPDVRQVRGVQAQVQRQMASSGAATPHADQRQRIAEALMYQTVTLIKVREQAQAERAVAQLASLADSAQATMARQDVDLRGMVLTDEGLVPRG
ncbi:MAG TPA: hypothetical protein PKO41_00600 [Dokdonella sp.]|uniref:hypothetical protein n=1 Tax=Dokdonella sp. TaxID=2291710 RepID=UPI0025C61CA7|nr:hypothetical protein [Dokdonella sp.]MBX3691592.1 hypothetical protein [Dokdonella sp.]MCW5567702.1 hypothetical protein [Dokdonella sp.]HNR90898.1 hypothetical protein [Dokdonella sp.]